ncbi:MAG: hypothetical protein ACTSVB_03170 [Candidatus Heimdallarchaeaceae archaeon]
MHLIERIPIPVKEDTSSLERIVTLDFLRGVAILFMTFAHCFYHSYDYSWAIENPELLLAYPKILVGIGALIAYLGSWNTFFLLISSIVNTYSMTKRIKNGKEAKEVFRKRLLSGMILLFYSYFIDAFGYYGYLGYAIRTGDWSNTYFIWAQLFQISTIQIISLSIIITTIINYYLLRNGKQDNDRKNLFIYGFLALAILVSTQFVHDCVDNMNWEKPTVYPGIVTPVIEPNWPNPYIQANNASIRTFFLVIVAGHLEPIFPCLATGFIGAMIGIILSNDHPPKKLPLFASLGGLIFIIIGIILIFLGLPYSLFNQRPEISTFIIQLGGQIMVVMLFLRIVEYRGKSEKFANNLIVKHFRLWAIASLSIFWLEIVDLFPKWILNIIFAKKIGKNLFEHSLGYGYFTIALGVGAFSFLFYELIVFLWSRVNFKGSFEWFLINLQAIGSKTKSKRLNVKALLNQSKYIVFVDITKEQKKSEGV